MREHKDAEASEFREPAALASRTYSGDFSRLAGAACALALCFARPLLALARFSARDEMYSHVLLVPAISAYLVWLNRRCLSAHGRPNRRVAATLMAIGAAAIAMFFLVSSRIPLTQVDSLAFTTFSFVFCFSGLCALLVAWPVFRAVAFPLGFLIFMVPFPTAVAASIESFLQHTSAYTAYALFFVTGTPVFFANLVFALPGINIAVAPQCSGIHSSLALLLTSVLAGYIFLRSPWRMAVLGFSVVPLAILRNGFRIFTIGELCVHIGPQMIDSYIHRKGGPVFFALSLVPFFLLLYLLIRSERASRQPRPASPSL